MDRSVELTKEIALRAGISVSWRGSSVFISADDAMSFIDAADSLGVVILGIEGFYVRDGLITPEVEVIADFSTNESQSKSVMEARKFLEAIEITQLNDLLLEFVLA